MKIQHSTSWKTTRSRYRDTAMPHLFLQELFSLSLRFIVATKSISGKHFHAVKLNRVSCETRRVGFYISADMPQGIVWKNHLSWEGSYVFFVAGYHLYRFYKQTPRSLPPLRWWVVQPVLYPRRSTLPVDFRRVWLVFNRHFTQRVKHTLAFFGD